MMHSNFPDSDENVVIAISDVSVTWSAKEMVFVSQA
jgi:hypothetical protein